MEGGVDGSERKASSDLVHPWKESCVLDQALDPSSKVPDSGSRMRRFGLQNHGIITRQFGVK